MSIKTKYTPAPDFVYHLTDDNHADFLKKTKKRNALIFMYIPQNQNSQFMFQTFNKVATLFSNIKTIIFAKVNCYETPGMCAFFKAPKVPAFRYLPFNMTARAITQPQFVQGEDMIEYLNDYLGKLKEEWIEKMMNNG